MSKVIDMLAKAAAEKRAYGGFMLGGGYSPYSNPYMMRNAMNPYLGGMNGGYSGRGGPPMWGAFVNPSHMRQMYGNQLGFERGRQQLGQEQAEFGQNIGERQHALSGQDVSQLGSIDPERGNIREALGRQVAQLSSPQNPDLVRSQQQLQERQALSGQVLGLQNQLAGGIHPELKEQIDKDYQDYLTRARGTTAKGNRALDDPMDQYLAKHEHEQALKTDPKAVMRQANTIQPGWKAITGEGWGNQDWTDYQASRAQLMKSLAANRIKMREAQANLGDLRNREGAATTAYGETIGAHQAAIEKARQAQQAQEESALGSVNRGEESEAARKQRLGERGFQAGETTTGQAASPESKPVAPTPAPRQPTMQPGAPHPMAPMTPRPPKPAFPPIGSAPAPSPGGGMGSHKKAASLVELADNAARIRLVKRAALPGFTPGATTRSGIGAKQTPVANLIESIRAAGQGLGAQPQMGAKPSMSSKPADLMKQLGLPAGVPSTIAYMPPEAAVGMGVSAEQHSALRKALGLG